MIALTKEEFQRIMANAGKCKEVIEELYDMLNELPYHVSITALNSNGDVVKKGVMALDHAAVEYILKLIHDIVCKCEDITVTGVWHNLLVSLYTNENMELYDVIKNMPARQFANMFVDYIERIKESLKSVEDV